MTTLSVCMIVKNEENNLERCLNSVQGVADEIVVVDTGSTDRTVEIAQAHGARVFHHAWQHDFSQARNVGIDQATGDWILIMDADEELEAETRPRLKAALAQSGRDALMMVVRNFLPPGPGARSDDFLHLRLFRNRPAYRYVASVHEQIMPSILNDGGKIGLTDLMLLHYGYMTVVAQQTVNRDQRNLALLEQALAQDPQSAYVCAKLGLQYYEAGDTKLAEVYLRRVLTLDYHGLSIFQFQYVLLRLGNVAFSRQDYAMAIECASDCLALLDRGNRAWEAMKLLAEIALVLARQDLQEMWPRSQRQEGVWVMPEDIPRLHTVRQHLTQGGDYLRRLLAEADFNDEGRSYIEKRAAQCASLLDLAGRLLAETTLHMLLEAEDVPVALEVHADRLDRDLLALVREKAGAARQAEALDLAEGLEALAAYIAASPALMPRGEG